MQVKMMTTAAGPNGVWTAGSIQNLPNDIAQRLIDAGAAILTIKAHSRGRVTAAVDVPERAVAPVQNKRG